MNPSARDYHLLPSSPCIGTGRYGRDRGALAYISSGVHDDKPLPDNYTSLESYPNPFNSSTRIEYNLTNPARVEIDIFNLLGQKVVSLHPGQVSSGRRSLSFTPDNRLSTGTYIVRLSADGLNVYRKIAYIK